MRSMFAGRVERRRTTSSSGGLGIDDAMEQWRALGIGESRDQEYTGKDGPSGLEWQDNKRHWNQSLGMNPIGWFPGYQDFGTEDLTARMLSCKPRIGQHRSSWL
jgi:hypothetical protein